MLTALYTRNAGKYTLLKEELGRWCSQAKVGHKMILAHITGNYVLEFKGKFKPKNKVKIRVEEVTHNG